MKNFIKVMKALSDANRVKILKMLEQKVLCVCEIQAALGISQPTVSGHLRVLEEAGLVSSRKSGSWVNYQLNSGAADPYAAHMLGALRAWLSDDSEVGGLVERLSSIRREDICGR